MFPSKIAHQLLRQLTVLTIQYILFFLPKHLSVLIALLAHSYCISLGLDQLEVLSDSGGSLSPDTITDSLADDIAAAAGSLGDSTADLDVGSMVEIVIRGMPRLGVILGGWQDISWPDNCELGKLPASFDTLDQLLVCTVLISLCFVKMMA